MNIIPTLKYKRSSKEKVYTQFKKYLLRLYHGPRTVLNGDAKKHTRDTCYQGPYNLLRR